MTFKRECGDCQLCCELLPVVSLGKLASTKCQFQKFHKGCTVHATPKMPRACSAWFCRWLVNDDAADLPRPDRARYVIDMLPDEILVSNDVTGEQTKLIAVQIWADPKHPDAWKDCKYLRGWIVRKAKLGFPCLIRHGSQQAMGVFAPPISDDGEWHMAGGTINREIGLWNA